MKIVSVSVRLLAPGQLHVSLGMALTTNEEPFEGYQDDTGILGLIAGAIDNFKEQSTLKDFTRVDSSAGIGEVSRDTTTHGEPAGEGRIGTPANPTEAPETGSGRRTRRGASAGDVSAATNTTAASTTTQSSETTQSTQRRRRSGSESPAPQSPDQPQPSSDQPETSVRRRRGTGAPAESAPTETAPATAPTISPSDAPLSRRRRGPATTEPSSPATAAPAQATATNSADATGDLTDADLSKAASEAARKIGPNPVMEIINGFTTKSGAVAKGTHEILPEDRADFIDDLKKACS